MRPIKLKIKGLNSFIEEQIIDFDKLTDRGLFGIFGPTGSGKSTVLDGITLALYGEVARESANYINTNCERANVSFEFQISGAESKRYLVEREFKKDKKTGNPRSGKCKVVDITTCEPVILADSVNEVKSICKEVIGLSLEDFTRTVVLPQGKFSEFLKLEGKARRDMLERLFNLQKYGDNLARKLSREMNKEKTENSILIGELKGYENITEDKQKEKEEEFNQINKTLEDITLEFEKLEKEYLENQDVWNLQIELKRHKEKEDILREEESTIVEAKEKIKLAESAEKVNPYITSYEKIINDIKASEYELNKLKENLTVIKIEKEKAEEEWKLSRGRKDNELSDLKLKEQKVIDALEEKKVLENLNKEISDLQNKIVELDAKKLKKDGSIKTLEQKITEIGFNINVSEEKIESLNIDNELKGKVQEGVRVSEKIEDLSVIVKRNKEKKESIEKEIQEGIENEKTLTKKVDEKNNEFKETKGLLEETIKNCPGEQEDLLVLQRQLSDGKEAWNKYNEYLKDIEASNISIEEYSNKIKVNNEAKDNLEGSLDNLKIEVKELEVENLAYKLRESLKTGEGCPVCGSIERHKENIKHIELKNYSEMEREIQYKEKELKIIEVNITKAETNISVMKNKIEQSKSAIESLGENFKNISVDQLEEKFNLLKQVLIDYNNKKQGLDNEVNKLKEENYCLGEKLKIQRMVITQNEKQLVELNDDYKKNSEDIQILNDKCNNLMSDTGINNFKEKNNEIVAAEKESEKLSKGIKDYRKEFEEINIKFKNLEMERNILREDIAKRKAAVEEKGKNKKEKITSINNKVGDTDDILQLLVSIEATIKNIEDNFTNAEKVKEETDKNYQQCNEKFVELTVKVYELNNRKDTEKETLENILKEQGFQLVEDAKKNIVNKIELDILKGKIEKFNDELSKTRGAIETVLDKINNRQIEEEQWLNIQQNKKQKEQDIKELNEVKIRLEEEVRVIKQKNIKLGDLLKKKAKLDHKLGLLSDLEKLFKGKKFVEFVAATRLKYISIEASKRLKEITNGNYGLEADENGKFIIRDYKNGGAERDASTLSGGETFLASLALALALSAEIQLKGTAPLELFFLDEGFGTLDDNLLEIVMGSLERIPNDKLKVGIISHVESIKNRVPVKLILTPAESGRGGSKVKIERS